MSSDFPFVRLSKFLDIDSVDYSPELKDDENIGYFKRKKWFCNSRRFLEI